MRKHGRQTATPYRGRRATPWKYELRGKPIRRGATYHVRLYGPDGALRWEGEVVG